MITLIVSVIAIWVFILMLAMTIITNKECKRYKKQYEAELRYNTELYQSIDSVAGYANETMRKGTIEFDNVLKALPNEPQGYMPTWRVAIARHMFDRVGSADSSIMHPLEMAFNAKVVHIGEPNKNCWERNGWYFFKLNDSICLD